MKKKCLGLLILMSLAVPSPSQTIYNPCPESCPRSELIKAYDSFFAVTWKLILYDKMQPVTVTPRGLKRPQNADNWLKEQLFSPSDIERIENAVSDWHTLRQAIWDAAEAAARARAHGSASFSSEEFQQKWDKISLDAGAKLERQLDDGERFHTMIQDCFRRLLLLPEYEYSCSFRPPKPRRT